MNAFKLLPVAIWLAAGAAQADVYKCIGEDGRVTYTNAKVKGCTTLSSDLPVSSVSPNSPSTPRKSSATPTPSSFPKVDGETQKSRDGDRKRILQEELSAEQSQLDNARKELATAESDPETFKKKGGGTGRNVAAFEEKVKPLQDKVSLHERNVKALEKELSNLR